MENASKALIIAGAILISILLIGLGVYVYTIAAGTTQNVDLSSQAAQAQNNQFSAYFGNKVSASQVKNLMNAIRSNNITGQTADEEKTITVFYNGVKSTTSAISQAVKPGKTYWVNAENDTALGTKEENEDSMTVNSPAYYNTGYLRIISVWEGSHGSSTSSSTSDDD